jgi:hypothetical protein
LPIPAKKIAKKYDFDVERIPLLTSGAVIFAAIRRSGEARCGGMSAVYKAKDLKLGRHVLNAGLRLPGAA